MKKILVAIAVAVTLCIPGIAMAAKIRKDSEAEFNALGSIRTEVGCAWPGVKSNVTNHHSLFA